MFISCSGPVAFLDILTPPYNPSEGRDCIYYTRQQPPSDLMVIIIMIHVFTRYY